MVRARDGFRPKHDGWDDLRRMWQRVPVPPVSVAPAPQPEPLPVVESPPLAPVDTFPAAPPVQRSMAERGADAGSPAHGSRPRPERLRAWFEEPGITRPRPARAPAAPAPRPFDARAALGRMVAFGQPDPLFAALYRAHPGGPPPDVHPGFEGGRQIIRPEPIYSRWEA